MTEVLLPVVDAVAAPLDVVPVVDVVAVLLDVALDGDVVASELVDVDVDVEVDVTEDDPVDIEVVVCVRLAGAAVGTVSPGAIASAGGGGAFGSAGPFDTFVRTNCFTGAGAGFTTTAFLTLKSFQGSPT